MLKITQGKSRGEKGSRDMTLPQATLTFRGSTGKEMSTEEGEKEWPRKTRGCSYGDLGRQGFNMACFNLPRLVKS